MSKTYTTLEMDVVRWAEARQIVQHGNPLGQARKTLEEAGELLEACAIQDRDKMIDAYGDILVSLIAGCATADLNLIECLSHAYEQIKNRKGHLTKEGIFVKE